MDKNNFGEFRMVYSIEGSKSTLGFGNDYRNAGIGYAVQIKPGMKPKDLPDYFDPIFEQKKAGSLASAGFEPLRYRGGKFYGVSWVKDTHSDYKAIETEIEPGDWIQPLKGGGVAHLLGQHRLKEIRETEEFV